MVPESCPVNFNIVQEHLAGQKLPIRQVNLSALMREGRSGAQLWQVESVFTSGEIKFAVVKIAAKGKQKEISDDWEGYHRLSKHWPEQYLPEHYIVIDAANVVSDDPQAKVLFSSYANPRDTRIATLGATLQQRWSQGVQFLDQICRMYQGFWQHSKQISQVNGDAYAHLKNCLDWLYPKIGRFSWSDYGLAADNPCLSIAGQGVPNICYYLLHPELWQEENFSLPYLDQHGDFHIHNILVIAPQRFVLIDFEKVGSSLSYCDLAFLLLSLAEEVLLARVVAADRDSLQDLARDMAEQIRSGQEISVDNAFFQPFLDIIRRLWSPLCRTELEYLCLPQQNRIKAMEIALAATALRLSYHKLRKLEHHAGHDANLAMQGYFFYALACHAINDPLLLKASSGVNPSNFSISADELPQSISIWEQTMAIPIANPCKPAKSFITKLIYPIKFCPQWLNMELPGWRRVTKIDPYKYLSSVDFLNDGYFQGKTANLLCWQPTAKGLLPCIFKFDLSYLPGKSRLLKSAAGLPTVVLDEIDLVPLPSKPMAFLGIQLSGSACTIEQYLQWVSQRLFCRLELATGNKQFDAFHPTIGGLRDELQRSLCNQSPIIPSGLGYRSKQVERPKIFQYLLLDSSQKWFDRLTTPSPLSRAWQLLATFSRPKPGYPKGELRISQWEHPDSLHTRYAIHRYGATILAHAGNNFNCGTKRHIFTKAHYLQWIVLRQLLNVMDGIISGITINEMRALHKHYDEETRRYFYHNCFEFFYSQELGS